MPEMTEYIRRDLAENNSLGAVAAYIKSNGDGFLVWKNYINHLLETNGGKYTRFADKIGFSKNTVKKWCLEGKKPQNRDDFIKIAFGLNMDLEQTNRLLTKYGSYAALYPKDLYDAIVIYVINRRQTDFGNPAYGFDSIEQWNARLNGIEDRMDFIVADVFDLLPKLEEEGSPYDFIILDPPAFTKSRKTVSNALRGYKEINKRAMHLLPRGGYLATCSCSHFADEEHFKAMLAEAAREAGVSLRQIEGRKQSPDHPILWGVPETDYLKFFLFQVV